MSISQQARAFRLTDAEMRTFQRKDELFASRVVSGLKLRMGGPSKEAKPAERASAQAEVQSPTGLQRTVIDKPVQTAGIENSSPAVCKTQHDKLEEYQVEMERCWTERFDKSTQDTLEETNAARRLSKEIDTQLATLQEIVLRRAATIDIEIRPQGTEITSVLEPRFMLNKLSSSLLPD